MNVGDEFEIHLKLKVAQSRDTDGDIYATVAAVNGDPHVDRLGTWEVGSSTYINEDALMALLNREPPPPLETAADVEAFLNG